MDSSNIKLSIITVVYNREKTLEQLISSVINQTYKNIEFIIIDGASTDRTLDIIKKYEYGISKWISENDTGIYNAMNKGISLATGDYIQFIGSDDCLVDMNVIKDVVIPNLADKPDVLSANEYLVYGDAKRQRIFSNSCARIKESYQGGMIGHAAMFTKRKIFDKYRFDESYKIAADYKFFLQCFYDETLSIKYIDDCVVFFETDVDGVSSNKDAAILENSRIYMELGLPFDDYARMKSEKNIIQQFIIYILKVLHMKKIVNRLYERYVLSDKHHCRNKICRWCSREMKI